MEIKDKNRNLAPDNQILLKMNYSKIFLSLLLSIVLSSLELSAQIDPSKPTKTWESNGLNTTQAIKNPGNIDLGTNQRKEVIEKMEKQEIEVNEIAISGDGRISKTEEGILNQIRTLKESIK